MANPPKSNGLQDRIDGRQTAEQMLDLVQLELEKRGVFFRTGFWRAIANRLPEEHHKQPDPRFKPRVMTDDQARKFEDEVVKFGKHSGQARRDIPLQYLEFIADSGLNMAAYLRSERGAARYAAEQADNPAE